MQTSIFSLLAVAGLVAAMPHPDGTQPTPTAPTGTTASSAPEVTCSPGPVVDYTVASGDTLTIISQKLNSGICNIAKENNLANPSFILLDQVLKVPTFPCTPDNISCMAEPSDDNDCVPSGEPTYTMVAGDTFFLVASGLGLTVDALQAANPGLDPLLIPIGQVINVPICNSEL
ncbi:hypothetical protein KVR01_004078 [Diaporthe batatas]|uniref:uncharacterized protein n=1 Tax=Diaporthe batatas TaxID=748121 RepID=UPI001D04174D|nr:uncharacterized protein KVR01_004078 [Diaporthe batatas]KAG8165526.1 hypothetical protein KVR01_004078 [Diaporthe batatas]